MKEIYLQHLAELRAGTDMSFDDLEEETGITASTINRWFNGKSNPSVDNLETVVTVMGGKMRDIFDEVGEQELRAAEKVGYKGTDALLAEFERREQINKEHYEARLAYEVQLRTQLQESFDKAIASLEASHAAALQKRDETYRNSVGYLKDDLKDAREKNRELMNRVAEAEKRADIAQAQRADIDKRRHDVFYAMLRLCIFLCIVFFIAGVLVQPPWEWWPIG